jgi:hypothetical protein
VNAPLALTGLPQSICTGAVISLGSAPILGHRYSWKSNPSGFTSTLSNPIDSPIITTTYYLNESVISSGCSNTDSVLITVIPRPIVKIKVDSIDAFTRKFSSVDPNYPANYYKWNIDNSDTATGFTLTHTFTNEGIFKTLLKVYIPGYCSDSDSVKVNINPPFFLNILPNPFATQTDIRYILPSAAHIRISIVDMLGREIKTLFDKNLDIGEYNTKFDASHLNTRPGVYIIVFMMDNKMITRKIVQLESEFY